MHPQQLRLKWGERFSQILGHGWAGIMLSTKMAAIVVVGVVSLVSLFAYLGTAALNENTQKSLQERVVLAQTTARHMDYLLAGVKAVLIDTAAQPAWRDPLQIDQTLRASFERLNFYATRVFIIAPDGAVIADYPPLKTSVSFKQFAAVQAALDGQPFAVSRYLRALGQSTNSTLAAAPLRDAKGNVFGALAISIDLGTNTQIFSAPIGLGDTGYIDLIDLGGVILASSRPERVGAPSDHNATLTNWIQAQRPTVSACHDCHTAPTADPPVREVLAFTPLKQAQWGVTVRQSEDEVFAPIRQLQMRIFILMGIMLAGALLLVYVTTRSVIAPVRGLTAATHRIAAGDLATPLNISGGDEIGILAQSFEAMRVRLQASIAEIQRWNRDLDTRVRERTAAVEHARSEISELYAELQRKEQVRGELLHRIFSAQEEERKRISRELHDETCQVLTGLAYALDAAVESTTDSEIKAQLEHMHTLASAALEEIHRLILDLRPTMLDHLGLLPALRWYAETRLSEKEIQVSLRETGPARRLPPAVETALFRVAQEAINNIARHSDALRAELVFNFTPGKLQITIADDGRGFDVNQVFDTASGSRGLGLLGMRERIDAIAGTLTWRSAPGVGTLVQLSVPLASSSEIIQEEHYATHSSFIDR